MFRLWEPGVVDGGQVLPRILGFVCEVFEHLDVILELFLTHCGVELAGRVGGGHGKIFLRLQMPTGDANRHTNEFVGGEVALGAL